LPPEILVGAFRGYSTDALRTYHANFLFRIRSFWLSRKSAVHSITSHTVIGLLSSCLVSSFVYLAICSFIPCFQSLLHLWMLYCYHFLCMVLLIWLCDRYFLVNDKGEKIEEQTGTVRTNCIDCLDRTNVTQVLTRLYHIHSYFNICCLSNNLSMQYRLSSSYLVFQTSV
jgi:hypothetical protein